MPHMLTILTSTAALMLVLWLSACQPGQNPFLQTGGEGTPSLFMSSAEEKQLAEADQAIEMRDYAKAEELLKPLAASRPADAELLVKLANSQRLQGKQAEALVNFDAALAALPGDPDALEGKGITLMEQTKFEEAAAILSQLIKTDGTRWRALNAIGVAFAATNRHPQAIQYYERALQVTPGNPLVLNNAGLSYAAEKRFSEGVSALKEAIGGFAADADRRRQAELNLSLIYGLGGMMDPAEMLLKKHLPEEKVYYNLGLYAKLRRDYDLAHTYLSKAVTSSPGVYENAWTELKQVKPLMSAE